MAINWRDVVSFGFCLAMVLQFHAGRYAFGFGFSFIKLFILHWAAVSADDFQIPVHRQAQIVVRNLLSKLHVNTLRR